MISDVMEFTKVRDYQSIMTAIDFEKAFDSLNWNCLFRSLEFVGFGASLVNPTFNHSLFYKLNFESIEKSLSGLLKSWDWRGLTLLEKIQVIKSFAIPKIVYSVVLISNKEEFI